MALYMASSSQPSSIRGSAKQYGIFQNDPPEHLSTEYVLIAMAADFHLAYQKLVEHASDEVSQRPEWGATKQIASADAKTYDVLGFDGRARTRYQIALLRQSGRDENGEALWMREPDWLAQKSPVRPKEYHGMIASVDCQKKNTTKDFLMGGYATVAEASQAMKKSARSYMQEHKGTRLLETSLELVDEKGQIQQRYQVVKGRWQYGDFVKEKVWLEKEAEIRMQDEGYGSFTSNNNNSNGTEDIPINNPQTPTRHFKPAQIRSSPYNDSDEEIDPAPAPENWCICQSPDDGSFMIACDNEDCAIQWYHGACIGFNYNLEGAWSCPDCAPKPKCGGKGKGKGKGKKVGAGTGAGVKKANKAAGVKERRTN